MTVKHSYPTRQILEYGFRIPRTYQSCWIALQVHRMRRVNNVLSSDRRPLSPIQPTEVRGQLAWYGTYVHTPECPRQGGP